MTFNRDLWSGTYDRNHFPSFPCPMCSTGNAKLDPESIDATEPAYSANNRDDADWEPSWDIERFSLKLTCDSPKCGEVLVVSGDTSLSECFDEEDNRQVFFAHLHPRAMFPAPCSSPSLRRRLRQSARTSASHRPSTGWTRAHQPIVSVPASSSCWTSLKSQGKA